MRRLRGILSAVNLTSWLVLFALVLLAVARPLEMSFLPVALLAGAAAVLGPLSRWAALSFEPPGQSKRSLSLALLLDLAALLGLATYAILRTRGEHGEDLHERLLQSVVLAQFLAGVMLIPFLARTIGRLGAVQLVPLLKALVYWVEILVFGALACGIASLFTESRFISLFGYVGPILACGFQLALRNLLVEVLHCLKPIPPPKHGEHDVCNSPESAGKNNDD